MAVAETRQGAAACCCNQSFKTKPGLDFHLSFVPLPSSRWAKMLTAYPSHSHQAICTIINSVTGQNTGVDFPTTYRLQFGRTLSKETPWRMGLQTQAAHPGEYFPTLKSVEQLLQELPGHFCSAALVQWSFLPVLFNQGSFMAELA